MRCPQCGYKSLGNVNYCSVCHEAFSISIYKTQTQTQKYILDKREKKKKMKSAVWKRIFFCLFTGGVVYLIYRFLPPMDTLTNGLKRIISGL